MASRTYLPTCLHLRTSLPTPTYTYLPTYRPTPAYRISLPTPTYAYLHLPTTYTNLPAYLPTYLRLRTSVPIPPTCLHMCIHQATPTCLLNYLHPATYTYVPVHIHRPTPTYRAIYTCVDISLHIRTYLDQRYQPTPTYRYLPMPSTHSCLSYNCLSIPVPRCQVINYLPTPTCQPTPVRLPT